MRKEFKNRQEAGQRLAEKLQASIQGDDVVVVALPRGGVPIGFEVARALHAPLDICVVRKLGVPRHPELAMGAIATGGVMVLNQELLASVNISSVEIQAVVERERRELERRERVYRGSCIIWNMRDRQAIVVDDGIATGCTMRAAIAALQKLEAKTITVAAPVIPPSTSQELVNLGTKVISLVTPEPLYAISFWYENFTQTTDEEVLKLLQDAKSAFPSSNIKSAQQP
ncbi:MAG TPA: phosphoribosyltransferase [Oscillatoriaceae cyanobacterium M33_DOE_052]|uniref:Phosphoribosyltransferase n=1 Tax=Planktothricoides sp. SpSt-374 TaxID=2282167 RepID=A0A7C3VL34_9CYAN|nr:phosphoribosyltransferase [Oscillatoriaceae cyanobacterium M33_DOE_052]